MNKKEQIVLKAIELFANEGYEGTSIQRLAVESGVAQGLLYRHFKNKEALLLHLVQMGVEQIVETLQPYHNDALSFREAFEEHIGLCCGYLKTHALLWKVLHSIRQNGVLMESLGLGGGIRELIAPIVNKLKQEDRKDAEIMGWWVVSLVDGVTAMYLLHPDSFPLSHMESFLIKKIAAYE